MTNENVGYLYLGIPEPLAEVLWTTVRDLRKSLIGQEHRAWAQLTSASLSRCVLHFSCIYREQSFDDDAPEIICAEVFHYFARQMMTDSTAAEWGVPRHITPFVAAVLDACGNLVVERVRGMV